MKSMKKIYVTALLLSAVLVGCNTTGSTNGAKPDDVSETNAYAKAKALLEAHETPLVRVVGTASQEENEPVFLSISDIQPVGQEILNQKEDVQAHLKLGGVT